eukprot:CAMPEP_0184492302 /NCGR_PEP_ID=MMETSP0113_2-20130426/22835_1 /TAXON_ID=91329 /ORGANISM="Norrisiella sphaerica, Strain BC52" /LENGTH=655 /DNA_ID=CAMNT_0026877025 /DNA_START=77 /DNA_END=2044 /DNA_ORIENTATION=+
MVVSASNQLPEAKNYSGKPFPLTYRPKEKGIGAFRLSEWISANKDKLKKTLQDHGAVLFRGFDLRSPEEQAQVISSLGLKTMPYVGGAAVRNKVVGDLIMTTNESPPQEPIPFHHEMAQCPEPPSHLAFMCNIPAQKGGATPILRSSAVYDYFKQKHPKFCQKMESLGVKYVRIMPGEDDPKSAIGRSWRNTFKANTKEEAEAEMKKQGSSWEWMDNDCVKTITATVPAIRKDERTGAKIFFNSVVAAFTGWIDSRNDPKKAVILGDGSLVDAEALIDVAKFMDKEKVSFAWEEGDVLLVDNWVTMHSRQPFEGPRRVMATVFRGDEADEKHNTPSAMLTSGDSIPLVGLGMWKIPKEVCPDIVVKAIKAGYRCFDNACDYGNEVEVGKGLSKAFELKLITRDKLWITSKLWNTYHAKEHVRAACLKTLKDLNLKYLDLYLIHFPIAQKFVPFEKRYPPEWSYDPEEKKEFTKSIVQVDVPIAETWAAMEQLLEEGLVKNIGVCNFNCALLRELLKTAKVKPVVNQVELHPYLTQNKLIRFCRRNGIHMTGFSNLGAPSYVELGMAKKADFVIDQKVVVDIAKAVGKTEAQVVLRWHLQRGNSIIPKTTKEHRLKENIGLFDFALSQEQMAQISALNMNRRFNDPGVFADIPIYD